MDLLGGICKDPQRGTDEVHRGRQTTKKKGGGEQKGKVDRHRLRKRENFRVTSEQSSLSRGIPKNFFPG